MNMPIERRAGPGRYRLAPATIRSLPRRLLSWSLWQTAALLLLSALTSFAAPEYAVAIALGVGASATRPRHLLFSPILVAATVLATASALALNLSGLLGAGLMAGAGVALLEHGRRDKWRILNTGLAASVLVPLGYHGAQQLTNILPAWSILPVTTIVFATVCAQVLIVMGLDWNPIARVPSPRRIRATLRPSYREPCLRAWELDRNLEKIAPDRDTREGLAEIGVWTYRLSLSLQSLDEELEHLALNDIQKRIDTTRESLGSTDDPYTRERRQATLRHLEGLLRHRDALVLERERTESLVDYALATLEEARTGLIYTHRMPGAGAPDGIDEVLSRLRSYSAQEVARRETVRELEKVP